jgi:multisubunit Na+/H+ antiporter MnhE subunit
VNALRTSILFLMLYLIFTRQITVGQFFSLFIFSFFIFGPLQELGTVINTYRETEASRLDRRIRPPCRASGAERPLLRHVAPADR